MSVEVDPHDKMFFLRQTVGREAESIRLHFGPLTCTLSSLLERGFSLQVQGKAADLHEISPRRYKIHLVRDREKYIVGKVSFKELTLDKDLTTWIKKQERVAGGWCVEALRRPGFVQPLPVPDRLIGNRTLKERVLDFLGGNNDNA